MKLAIVSDLHLEFGDINLQNTENADVLIIAGDLLIAQDLHDHPEPGNPPSMAERINLGSRQKKAYLYRDFLKRVSFQFPQVIIIAGNHEFYHGKWVGSLVTLRAEYSKHPNITFLERDSKLINDVLFVGGTLWTDCNKDDPLTLHALTDLMNDFTCIRNDGHDYTKLRPIHTMSRHQQTLDYFKIILEQNKDKKCVIVGHHAPSFQSIAPEYVSQNLMNGAFVSDLSEFILDHPQIKLWIHGHMHANFDYLIGDTRVICNPRGYIGVESNANYFKLQYVEV